MKLQVGDVVRLKSGGPLMTIDVIKDDRDGTKCAHTVWYDEKAHENRYAHLPIAAFVKVPDGLA